MSKGYESPEQEKNNYCRQQWEILCAKHGQPEASMIKSSGLGYGGQEPHNARKTMRRAVNAIVAKLGANEYSGETTAGLHHAAKVIAEINSAMDYFDSKSNSAVPGMKALRNAADFSKHYKTEDSNNNDHVGEMSIADFLRGVANLRTMPEVQNALSTGTDTAGGFAVPSRLMPGILSALTPVSSLMQAGAGIVPMEEGAKTFTTAAVNAIPTAAWRLEAGTLSTSDPTFRSITATPRSLSFQFKISRELLADGVGINQALYTAIAQSFARELDRVGLRGSGTAPEPRGVLNTTGIQAVTNGANGTALGSYSNLFSAVQSILQADAPMPTAAIMSPRSLVKLGGLADTTNQPLRVPGMLEPMKLIGTSQIPNNLTVGTSSDCSEIYVGDFTNLYFAMRESVSVQMLQELYAATGEIGFACHMRADVVLTYPAAFAVVTGVRA